MPKNRKTGYTSIGIPIYIRDRLREYGTFGESWGDLFERMIKEIDDAKLMRERYRLK